MTPEDSVEVLLRWCDAHGIVVDDRIRVVRGDEGDIAVFSATDAVIERGTTLVTIPKTSILSIKSCALSNLITPVIYGREAQLGLALGLYGELLRGNTSFWAGYLYSLPDAVDLAYSWTDEDEDAQQAREWISGTMAERELQDRTAASRNIAKNLGNTNDLSMLDEVRRYYVTVAEAALAQAGLGQCATFNGYKHAFSLVSSRAFFVDAYHGLAMVPIADAFNHCLENQVHLESDYDVCPRCGSLLECPHDTEDSGNDAEDDEKENLQLRARRLDPAGDALLSAHLDAQNTCEMVTNAPILPFAEVWNTYGETLSNAQLLVRYGFLLDGNENDLIAWDPRDLKAFASSVFGEVKEGVRNPDIPCEEEGIGIAFCGGHELARRAIISKYQGSNHIGKKRDRNIKEAHCPTKAGANDDRRLLCDPGSPTSRLQVSTLVNNSGAVSSSSLNCAVQGLLEQLDELISQWHCGDSDIWESSNLVYDPYCRDGVTKRYEAHYCTHRHRSRGEETEDPVSKNAVSVTSDPVDSFVPSGMRGAGTASFQKSDDGPALDARVNDKATKIARQQHEDLEYRFTEDPVTINYEPSASATGRTVTLCGCHSMDRNCIGSSRDGTSETERLREVHEGPGSSNPFASGSTQNFQLGVKAGMDSQLLHYAEPKLRNHTFFNVRNVDPEFVKRLARAQVKLEELCEALSFEEEEGNSGLAEASSSKVEGRRWRLEGFLPRRVGSQEVEAQRHDDIPVYTANESEFRPLNDNDSGHPRNARKPNMSASAIDAIKRYGDSEDEEGEDEQLVPDQTVSGRNYENTNKKSMPLMDTKIRSIAHDRPLSIPRRRRDGSREEGQPTLGVFAGSSSGVTEDDRSNSSASRARKRRRRVSPAPAPVSPTNRLLSRDVDGTTSAAVSEEAGEICLDSTPSLFERSVRQYNGRLDSALVRVQRNPWLVQLDRGAGADGLHAINSVPAREDGAAPLSPTFPRIHASCLNLGEGEGGRARALVPSATPERNGERVAVAVPELYGPSNSDENSVSDVNSGNCTRLPPVAFGVRMRSGLDIDMTERVESGDDHGHAQKPEANLLVATDPGVAIRPYEEINEDVGAETSPDVAPSLAGASKNGKHNHVNYTDNQHSGNANDPNPVDSLAYIDFVVSIAQAVTAFCTNRIRSMRNPGLDARTLGELADGIPAKNTKTRLAAQLALAERSLLESWRSAWDEFRRKLESIRAARKL